MNIVIGIAYEPRLDELHYNTLKMGEYIMAERIRAIITGYDVTASGEVKTDTRNGEQTNYPIILPEAAYGACRATLVLFLSAFVNRRNLGRVPGEGTAFNLEAATRGGIETSVAPDISFVSFERLPVDAYVDTVLRVSPDLAVEIVSPSDSFETVLQKVMVYLDHEVSQVWLLAPRRQEILTFTPENREGARLTLEDDLRGEGLLSGFSVPVRAIFEVDNALQVEVLRKLIGR